MPADALNYLYVTNELNATLQNGRIDKISMPEADEIILAIRAAGQNLHLVISANSEMSRCHLTSEKAANPLLAPSFLMHLRKHIGGATIERVNLVPYERIICFHLLAKNELGYAEPKTLIAEIMGKYSNIILVNSDGKISEAIKHITLDTSAKRQILPGLPYVTAPAQEKISLQDKEAFKVVLTEFEGGRLDKAIMKRVSGFAPLTIEYAVFKSLGTLSVAGSLSLSAIQSVTNSFIQLYNAMPQPCIFTDKGDYKDFAFAPYTNTAYGFVQTESMNKALELFYSKKNRTKRIREKSTGYMTVVKNAVHRTEKKIVLLNDKLAAAANLENDKLYGELITANMYRLKQGIKLAELENYYLDPPESIFVPLDENKSPQYNAQKYYKSYNKKKKTIEMAKEQLQIAEENNDYYRSILQSFDNIDSLQDLDDIALELEENGLITLKKTKKTSKKPLKTTLNNFVYQDYTIFYGKNNAQNDSLTKGALPWDIWLHVQKIHGCHVIIRNEKKDTLVPESVLYRAAQIAAFYSKASLSTSVPVDYTFAKYVHKPKGAALGKVIYTNQKTLYAAPLGNED